MEEEGEERRPLFSVTSAPPPAHLLDRVRRRIVGNQAVLLPFEREQFWERWHTAHVQQRLYFIVLAAGREEALAVVGAPDFRRRSLDLLSVCLAGKDDQQHLAVLLEELAPWFDTFAVYAYHDDPAEHRRWISLGFRGVSFHRRPDGDRLRFVRTGCHHT